MISRCYLHDNLHTSFFSLHNFAPHVDICICVKTWPENRHHDMLAQDTHALKSTRKTLGKATTYKVSSFSLLPQRWGGEKHLEQLCAVLNSTLTPTQTCIRTPASKLRNDFTNAPSRLKALTGSLAFAWAGDFWFSLQAERRILTEVSRESSTLQKWL